MADKAREYKLIPEYVEEFFKRIFVKAGGRLRTLKQGFITIESVPYEIRRIAESVEFKNRYGVVMKRYPKVTFDKDIAFKNPNVEFISFGHPLFEALLKWIFDKFKEEVKKGALFKDPSAKLDGYIWFYIGEVKDGKGDVAGRRIWLYVVANAATNPTLHIINNPWENLNPQEKVEVVRFVVPTDEWKNKKQEVWKKIILYGART